MYKISCYQPCIYLNIFQYSRIFALCIYSFKPQLFLLLLPSAYFLSLLPIIPVYLPKIYICHTNFRQYYLSFLYSIIHVIRPYFIQIFFKNSIESKFIK